MDELVKQRFEFVDKELAEVKGDVKDHEGRVSVMEGTVNALCEDMKEVKDNSKWAVRLLVAIIVGAVLKSVLGI